MPRFKPPPPTVPAAPDPERRPAHDGPLAAIGDIAREFGVTLRTLRFYESKGMLKPERRGLTRLYSAADRTRLATILKGKELGLSLREIRASLAPGSATSPTGLRLSTTEVERKIAVLEAQKHEIERALAGLREHGGTAMRPRRRKAA